LVTRSSDDARTARHSTHKDSLMLFTRLLWIFIAVVWAAPAHAQQGAWDKTFLWQVQKGENKVFLLGSLSVGKRRKRSRSRCASPTW
jgi:uncharacterized protein YbaP (TraB family)